MNYLKNILEFLVPHKFPAAFLALRGLKNETCDAKGYQNTWQKSKKRSSIKIRPLHGSPRKALLLNNSKFPSLQKSKFKNITDNRFNEANKEEVEKSLKDKGDKTLTTIVDQEARSYARLIANYSRAMETDTIYSRSFERTFGSGNLSLSNSAFETVMASFASIQSNNEARISSNMSTKSCSMPSFKPPRVRDFQTDTDKNGSILSFYSTDSGRGTEWMKKGVEDINHFKGTEIKEKDFDRGTTLDEKDILNSLDQRADWLDRVVTRHKTLKTSKMAEDPEKEQLQSSDVSAKDLEDSMMEKSSIVEYPLKMESSLKMNSRQDINSGFIGSASQNDVNQSSSINTSESGNSDSSSPSNYIQFRINGKPSSEVKTITIQNDEIKVVSSADKIEIRIPIISLIAENETEDVHPRRIKKAASTLKLQISAEIEEEYVVDADENKSHYQEQAEPQKRIEVKAKPADEKPSISLEKSKTAGLPNKNLPWWAQSQSENKSGNVVNSPKEERKDLNSRVKPSEEKQEGIDKTNLSITGKNVSLESKKLEEAAASAKSNKKSFVVTSKTADSKNLETSSTKSEKAVKDSQLQGLAEVKAQKKKEKEVDNNISQQQSLNNLSDVLINKSRRRKKGSTPISKVIENELEKKNEQTVIKDKKDTTLTTETEKKKPPDTEAVRPEAGKKDQDIWTIDKVPKKTDEVIGQKVEKKLSDSVTRAKNEKDEKVLGPSNSATVKNKQKNQAIRQPLKKEIDETNATGGKLDNKLATATSRIQLSGSKPTPSFNSPTAASAKTNKAYFKHAVNIKSLERSAKLIDKKGASQRQKPDELQVKEAKKDSKGLNVLEKSKSPLYTEKFDSSKSTGSVATSPILKKSEAIKSKDIPNDMKPLEKKKDGTLIDYGLKVSSRKSSTEDFRKLNSTESKQSLVAGTIKEVSKKEKSLTSGEKKKITSKSSWESFQVNKAQEKLAGPKKKADSTGKLSKFSDKEDHSSKDVSLKNIKITSPNLKSEFVKLNSPDIKQGVNSARILVPKSKETYFQILPSRFPSQQPKELQWVASALKPNILKMTLQLEEFEENHIFSGADHHLKAKD